MIKMAHYYQKIQGWFDFADLYSLMVKTFPSGSHFVEVGTYRGKSAVFMGVEIYNSGKSIKLDCIDDWLFTHDNYDCLEEYKDRHKVFGEFLANIKVLRRVVNYHKLSSADASKLYADRSLEFVYLDASHRYEYVMEDLKCWFPKVKNGGVIAGHDRTFEGVRQALDEFFVERSLWLEFGAGSWIHYKS